MTGLYIHIPFCKKKCAYCDFVSEAVKDHKAYFNALEKEIGMYADSRTEVNTVFFGGGTPSFVDASEISRIMKAIKYAFNVLPAAEVSIEANPGTVDKNKLAVYKEIGINRISFGLQSADDAELKILGRIHTCDDFRESFHMAREIGFENINIDLIFGLPHQTPKGFLKTLDTALAFHPAHVSCYALKLEPGTPMHAEYAGSDAMPDEDTEREIYHGAVRMLDAAGYIHYETSNFAKPGFYCRHNLKYWRGEPYLGFGAAAHAFFYNDGAFFRQQNDPNITRYTETTEKGIKPIAETTRLSETDIRDEYIMLRLRLAEGIRFQDFNSRFGIDFAETFKDQIRRLTENGLIFADSAGIYPTLRGFDLQNTLIGEFL